MFNPSNFLGSLHISRPYLNLLNLTHIPTSTNKKAVRRL